MLVIVGLSVFIGAAIAHAASARAAHPPTENERVRLSPSEVDRSVVPLPDHGRCGGVALTERSLDWLPADRGHTNTKNEPTLPRGNRRCPTRKRAVPALPT